MLERLINLLATLLFRQSVLIGRRDKIQATLNDGFKTIKRKKDKSPRKVFLTIIQRLKLEGKLRKIIGELFDVEIEIKDVKFQIDVERKRSKDLLTETIKKKVQAAIKQKNALVHRLFQKALENGSINELMKIKNNFSNSEYELNDFKKDIIPILNKYRNVEKYPPINSLSKQLAEELRDKVIKIA